MRTMGDSRMTIKSYWYDDYGNLNIEFSDGTIVGGAVAEEYARLYGL